MKKLQLFYHNHGLSRLQKWQFCLVFKSMFYLSRKACSFNESVTKYFFWVYFASKQTLTKTFDQNHGLTPLQKCQFCGFLKPMFLLFRKACLLDKTSKIVFSRFIFTIYDIGIEGVTRGLQRVTGGYKGLQGVTKGYRGLQGVRGGYNGLQRGDRG